jgi:hypothetical protein
MQDDAVRRVIKVFDIGYTTTVYFALGPGTAKRKKTVPGAGC